MAGAGKGGVLDFQICKTPCRHWPNSASNLSRKKKSGRGYEIQIIFADRTERDIMIHLSSGQGRDCYRLENNGMVLKWFQEVNEYPKLHSDEYKAYHLYANMPVGRHLPCQFGYGHRVVRDAGNRSDMTVDCQLSEFVGRTLMGIFADTHPDSPEVAIYFVKLLQMIQRFMEADIAWESDFHAANICYCESSGVWKHVDMEKFDPSKKEPKSAINVGARKLLKSFQETESIRKHVRFQDYLRHHCTHQFEHPPGFMFDGTPELVSKIGMYLGVDMTTLEARHVAGCDCANTKQRMPIESVVQAGAPSWNAVGPPAEARLWDVLVGRDVDDVRLCFGEM